MRHDESAPSFEKRIRTIQINFDSRDALQWRTSHLAFLRGHKTREILRRAQSHGTNKVEATSVEATNGSWKSGSVVRLMSGGEAMKVIGRDSVGSVICRPLTDERHLGIYVPPSLLVAAAIEPNAGTSAPSMDMATENA